MPKIGKVTFNKPILIVISVVVIIVIVIFSARIFTPEDNWLCENGTWTRHGNPTDAMPTLDCPKDK